MSNVLLVAADPDLRERVRALPGHRVVTINHVDDAADASIDDFAPDLVVLGTGVSLDRALEYGRTLAQELPHVGVVLVAEPESKLRRQASRAGFADVVAPTIGGRELAALLDGAAARPHQIITVLSPKGGVGRTVTAVSLAALLAAEAPWQVVLIDLDLQFGDVSTVLDLAPEHTISDALGSTGTDSMKLRSLLTPHQGGSFSVLCAPRRPGENAEIVGDEIRKLVSQLSMSFRYVVIDTSAGLSEETLSSLEEATDVVVVTALDVATLRSARKAVDVLGELDLLPSARHVVLNRSDRRSGLTPKDAERMLGLPIHAVVPYAERVALAANHGELADVVLRKSSTRAGFRDLARSITDPTAVSGHRRES